MVEDLNVGGAGGRWAISHAMEDWRDDNGDRRTQLGQGSLFIARGLALPHEDLLPWFKTLRETANEMFPNDVVEIHLDNAKIHLYSDDWNPRDS